MAQKINEVTVALVAITPEGSIKPYCTGVWVNQDTLVTATHCVDAAKRLALGNPPPNPFAEEEEDTSPLEGTTVYYIVQGEVDEVGKNPYGLHSSKAILADRDHDIAVLAAEGKVIPPHGSAKLAKQGPGVGEVVLIVGQVRGLYWSYITGVVSAYRDDLPNSRKPTQKTQGPFMQLSAPVFYGNSGGGAFNSDGELVGIASFLGGAPSTSMFIHIQTVRKALKDSVRK